MNQLTMLGTSRRSSRIYVKVTCFLEIQDGQVFNFFSVHIFYIDCYFVVSLGTALLFSGAASKETLLVNGILNWSEFFLSTIFVLLK